MKTRKMNKVSLGDITIGAGAPLVLIAGPCVIESESSTLYHAKRIRDIAAEVGIPFIFKSSYDKANRTSVDSFRGPGVDEGLRILKRVKDEIGVAVTSDVHTADEIEKAKGVLDILQIPAFLSRQTDLLIKAASTGRVVNVKKGQFLSPWDIRHVIKKVRSAGGKRILLTERGTSFGYNNLVTDFRSLMIMKDYGAPVIFDGGHSVQLPGGGGNSSGGDRRFIAPLVCAAAAVGTDGIFVEVHRNPAKALCDGPNMLALKDLRKILIKVKGIAEVAGRSK